MFDLDRFIADCGAAVAGDSSHKAAREIVARAVSDPAAVLARIGEPQRAGVEPLYHSETLTILNVVWGPRMTVIPHNHLMWAVIGVYTGREDNIFWRRLPADPQGRADTGRIEAAGARSIGRARRRAARPRHHSHRHQPAVAADRRDPCLRRRFLCRDPQRVGSRDPGRTALRHGAQPRPVRGGEPRLGRELKSRR